MTYFTFVPSARLQRILGRELIADPNIAVVEFVKNAYDAGASEVHLEFELADRPAADQLLTIADDGVGMDVDSFVQNWMKPGYSYKSLPNPPTQGSGEAAKRQAERIPVGEKGLGRLAAARLGDEMEIFTRRAASDKWLHVTFEWAWFDDMSKRLDSIQIPFELVDDAPGMRFDQGTLVRISKLSLNWAGFVPGRKVVGRSDMRFGRLHEDLSILVRPFDAAKTPHFSIFLNVDAAHLSKKFGGSVEAPPLDLLDIQYDFSIRPGKSPKIQRVIQRSHELASELSLPRLERYLFVVGSEPTAHPLEARSGPIKGRFQYFPRSASRVRELGLHPGVFLYRDGVRVEPYGHGEDDWLGAQARKASRQGYASIQPKHLFGWVEIGRAENPGLVDMSNRQGLVQNEAADDLLGHVRAEFRHFEERVLDEVVRPSWERPEEKAQRAAYRAQTFTAIIVRSLLHSIRNPASGLGLEIQNLESMLAREEFPEELRERANGIVARTRGHLQTIEATLERAIRFYDQEETESVEVINVAEVVEEAIGNVKALAETHSVSVDVKSSEEVETVFDRAALSQVIAELLRNAVEAPRPAGRPGRVELSVGKRDGFAEVLVADNGHGISQEMVDEIFRRPTSSKGRPGGGLLQVSELLALYGGRAELVETGPDGTKFAALAPTLGTVRKAG